MSVQYTPFGEGCNTVRGIPAAIVAGIQSLLMESDPADLAYRRRTALRAYLHKECGGVEAELARRIGRSPSQVADMLAEPPRKSFGEKIARDIEKRLRLPPGQLDQGAQSMHLYKATALAPGVRETLERLRAMLQIAPPDDRKPAMSMIESWLMTGNRGALRAAETLLGAGERPGAADQEPPGNTPPDDMLIPPRGSRFPRKPDHH
jgi:hypothetical protein